MSAPAVVCDVLIIGGGLAGSSLGIALGQLDLRCALIEAAPFKSSNQPNYDDRAIALAYGSRRIFEGLGLWAELADKVTPIRQIQVTDRGHFGATRLDARAEGVDALGYVLPARELGQALSRVCAAQPHLDILSPARLDDLVFADDHVRACVGVDGATRYFQAKLVVAADGGQSTVRQLAGIESRQRDYRQTAIFANVTSQRPHDNIAYERFTEEGPLALLPMSDQRRGLIWTRRRGQADACMNLSDEDFLHALGEAFAGRFGRFLRVGARRAYPLELGWTSQLTRERLVLVGNAAHTLHPIAGQGFNLGLRDVAALAQTLADAVRKVEDPGAPEVLQRYAQWRRFDQNGARWFTDGLARVFSNRLPPLVGLRNLGLVATDLLPPLKHQLTRHAMGQAGRLPRLARGLPL